MINENTNTRPAADHCEHNTANVSRSQRRGLGSRKYPRLMISWNIIAKDCPQYSTLLLLKVVLNLYVETDVDYTELNLFEICWAVNLAVRCNQLFGLGMSAYNQRVDGWQWYFREATDVINFLFSFYAGWFKITKPNFFEYLGEA